MTSRLTPSNFQAAHRRRTRARAAHGEGAPDHTLLRPDLLDVWKLCDGVILSLLSELNLERQAEEAAGHVRYLRPAFQAPGETTQAEIDLAAPEVELETAEPESWPSDTAARARALALRRVLREAARPLSVEDVARRFKRAPRAVVADLLDTLASLGQARRAADDAYAA